MSFFVQFWGVRGSIPTPGRKNRRYGGNTTCVALNVGDELFICDVGTGIRELGVDLLKNKEAKSNSAHIFISHPHWDHIQGFPFFAPIYNPKNSFQIYGENGNGKSHFELLNGQMKSDYFPVEFSDLQAKIKAAHIEAEGQMIGQARVSYLKQVHPGGSLGYKFEAFGKTVIFSTDNELDLTIKNKQDSQNDVNCPRQVSTKYLDFIRGADLLIADGQYTDEEYKTKIGWGHACCTTVVDAAIAAGVKQLAITHHDPMHSDHKIDEKIATCKARAMRQSAQIEIFAAREKMQLKLA